MLKVEVLNDACPFGSSGTVAKTVAPSLKITDPLGVPGTPFVAVTVAVNVTSCPKLDGLDDELTAGCSWTLNDLGNTSGACGKQRIRSVGRD